MLMGLFQLDAVWDKNKAPFPILASVFCSSDF
jgi:hypothetical protein